MVPKVKIWCKQPEVEITERHRYATYVAFEAILEWEVAWCAEEEQEPENGVVRIQYGGAKTDAPIGAFWIPASDLLSSTGVNVNAWEWSHAEVTPGRIRLPFGVRQERQGVIESDWLSWVFWMASRMEECGSRNNDFRDSFGRFKGSASLAHQEGWLEHPILEKCVRAWARKFVPDLPLPIGYRVQPTVDVDSAFAYRYKGLKLTIAASLNDFIRGRWARFLERPWVMLGFKDDPYDTYKWLEQEHAKVGLRATYFFLLANRGKRDRGVPWNASELKQRIEGLKSSADIGIHPGCAAHDDSDDVTMFEEIRRLTRILKTPVQGSRQHYLLQRIPESWRRLERLEIKTDHSLGYADSVGFRAGMSRPFRAYDLTDERIMNLVLHPVAVMDATLMRHLKLSPAEALKLVDDLSCNVREVEGVMVLLWHNESVSNYWQWKGWKTFYQEVLATVVLK